MKRRLWATLCRAVLLLALLATCVNVLMLAVIFPAITILMVAAAIYQKLYLGGGAWSWSYGSARLATWRDLVRSRLLSDTGLILGRPGFIPPPTRGQAIRSLLSPWLPSELACRQLFAAFGMRGRSGFIRTNTFTHLATFAPAASGKSVSVLVPNLLSYEGNCVVVDPKGELFRLTSEHRRKQFGHKIVRLDPALLCGPGADRYNVLDAIDPDSKHFLGQCRDLANMLVVRTGKELDTHWNDSAENVISAFIAYVCSLEGEPTVRNLRGMRTQIASRLNYLSALERMQNTEEFWGVLEQLGQSLTWHVDKELGSVMSTTNRHTSIFDDPLIDDATSSTSFDPGELRAGRMTVYLIIPADLLEVWAGVQRLFLGSIMRHVTRGEPTEKNPVLFLVDECAHIGKMRALEQGVTLMRGSGIRMWLFFQALDQMKGCFGDNYRTVMSNLQTQQHFGITDYEHAEELSKWIGDATITVRSTGRNTGRSTPFGGDGRSPGSISSGTSENISEIARRLFKPEEIRVLPESKAMVWHKNNYVMIAERIKYYSDKDFRRGPAGYGTGRTRGLGLGSMLLAVGALLLSCYAMLFIASLPVPYVPQELKPRQRPGIAARRPIARPGGYPPGFGTAGPWQMSPQFNPSFSPAPPEWRQYDGPARPARRKQRSYP
jgi:type IV secretion system protein VirD4